MLVRFSVNEVMRFDVHDVMKFHTNNPDHPYQQPRSVMLALMVGHVCPRDRCSRCAGAMHRGST